MKKALVGFANTPDLTAPIQEALSNEGYKVTTFDGMHENIYDKVAKGNYDLIVTEIVLAPKDGLILLQEYKMNNPNGIFILITGIGGSIAINKAFDLGLDGYYIYDINSTESNICNYILKIVNREITPIKARDRLLEEVESLKPAPKIYANSTQGTNLTGLFALIGVTVILCLGFTILYSVGSWLVGTAKGDDEEGAFWHGTKLIQVCEVPYYSSNDCYNLNVSMSEDESVAQIYFNNGGWIITEDIQCYKAATFDNEPDYTFCRSWDNDGNQWDFMPIWVNY